MFSAEQINAAIEAEVADWSRGWDEQEPESLERRRAFHRANVAAGHLGVLKAYLGIVPVLAYRLEEAQDALKKLAKKAERYGTPRISWKLGERYEEERQSNSGRRYKVEMVDLILDDVPAPRVGTYTFLAKGEIVEGGAIVDTVPGKELPADVRSRLGAGACDHCGNNRFRKYTYAVQAEDGSVAVVGHTCLRDFLGTDTPASVAARFRFMAELKAFDEDFSGGRGSIPDNAQELLAVTAAAIRLWGWVPKSAPEHVGEPTAERIAVWYLIAPNKYQKEEQVALEAAICDADYELASRVMEWIASDEAGDSDYIQNLRLILAPGAVEAKRRGYACSAVAAYQRHLGKLEERRKAAETVAVSQWVGTKGERLRGLKLRLESAKGFSGQWGDTLLYKFKDDAGNIFTWFASGSAEIEIGAEVVLDATVKDHKEYNGGRETVLTRGKVVSGA